MGEKFSARLELTRCRLNNFSCASLCVLGEELHISAEGGVRGKLSPIIEVSTKGWPDLEKNSASPPPRSTPTLLLKSGRALGSWFEPTSGQGFRVLYREERVL